MPVRRRAGRRPAVAVLWEAFWSSAGVERWFCRSPPPPPLLLLLRLLLVR